MTRVTVSVTVAVIFFFITLSRSVARIQVSKPKYDVTVRQLSNVVMESDVKASIRLPSESNEEVKHSNEPRPNLARPEKNEKESRPIVNRANINTQKAQPVEPRVGSNDKREKKPIKNLSVEHKPKSENKRPINDERKPIKSQPEVEAEKAQPVEPRVGSNDKGENKPIKNLPIEHKPKLDNKWPIKNESKPIKSQPEVEAEKGRPKLDEEQSKPVENRAELNEEEAQPELNTEETQPEPNAEEARPVEPAEKAAAVKAVPLTEVRFRPINHHFRLRSRLPYRLCRHHNHNHGEETKPAGGRREVQIRYGNGIMLTSAGNNDLDQQEIMFPFVHRRGPHHFHQNDVNKKKIPNRLPENSPKQELFQQDLDDDEEENDVSDPLLENDHEKPKNFRHHRHNHHHHHNGGDDEKKESPLRRRIRKFLGHYFD